MKGRTLRVGLGRSACGSPTARLVGVALPLFAACGEAPRAGSVTVTDSAGVEIVHSAAPGWGAGEAWTIGAEPTVEIGVVEGDPAYQLLIVTDATRLSDGRIVVANAGTAELRYYDGSGRHLQTVGGQGEGPGEFRVVANVWRLAGDSILTFDAGVGRLTVFDPDGGVVRTIRPEHRPALGVPSVGDRFGDGSLLVTSGAGVAWGVSDRGLIEGGEWIFSRFGRDGRFANEIARYRGGPRWAYEAGGTVGAEHIPFVNGVAPHAAGDDRFYAGSGEAFSVEAWTLEGEVERIFRRDFEPRPIGQQERARYREHRLESARSETARRRVAHFVGEVTFPDRMPAYQGLLVDELGHLWAEHFRAPWEEAVLWSVFDPEGRWLGEVETPGGLQILRIGTDAVLGVARDALDVEYVRLFPLARGNSRA